jgi:sulfite reductase alpha subunit-like flavoprotein
MTGNTLYFGCRHASKDQHYNSEFHAYAEHKSMTYRVACSQDGPEGVKQIYVQDLITEDGQVIWNLLGPGGGCVYISG